jgi:hypothetical protein
MTTELHPHGSARTVAFETCEHCDAPVEPTQRYCVVCGTRRRHVPDPAARFISQATARSRAAARVAVPATGPRRRGPGLGAALALAVIPAAVGLGVLVGRGSVNNDAKLIAALRAQKPEVVNVGGGSGGAGAAVTTASSSSQSVAVLSSDFPLQSGYSVELSTLPASSHRSAVLAAEKAAKANGAAKVGLVTQSDYTITPKPKSGTVVIYAGAYKTKAEADQALSKLKAKFPHAVVISLRSAGSSTAGAGKVLTQTRYGTAHQVTGFHATKASLAQGAQVVNKVAKTLGKSYVGAQTGLPSQVSVP